MKYWILTGIMCMSLLSTSAQEEKGWLKRLFEKDSPEKKQEEPASADSLNFLLDEFLKKDSVAVDEADSIQPNVLPGNGQVNIIANKDLLSLDKAMIDDPQGSKGYRVQIFFGKIEAAKEARVNFIRNHPNERITMEHVPPNFSVQVGAHIDKLEAYRHMKELKREYPDAILIPATILPEQQP